MEFDKVQDNGGSPISNYKLYIASDNGIFSEVESYNGQSLIWTISQIDEDTLITGTLYQFKVSAVNTIGESELSNSETIAMAS